MYYLISFSVYFLILAASYFYLRKNLIGPKDKKKFKNAFVRETRKGRTKSDLKNRKIRKKDLPLYQRFLYWSWFWSVAILMIVLFPAGLTIGRLYLLEFLYAPNGASSFDMDTLAMIVFGVGAWLAGIPVVVAYSYLTNRGVIRKADKVYCLGSFQEYPKQMNVFIAIILLLIGLPVMILSFHSYKYFTDDTIVVRSALQFSECIYDYSSINYVQRTLSAYPDERSLYRSYVVIFKDGKKVKLRLREGVRFEQILDDHNCTLTYKQLKPLFRLE